MLQNEGRSTAEFFAEAAAQYVDSRTKAEPGEIELLGFGPKRVFTGRTLYRHQTRDDDLGVFLTAKGSIAYWYCCPGALDGVKETFTVFDTLDDLWEQEDWLNKKNMKDVKQQIQQEYIALTHQPIVERLDI
jgi:hypothetical protein